MTGDGQSRDINRNDVNGNDAGRADKETIDKLRQEVARLQARVARLEKDKTDLLARANRELFERPPHYQ